MQGDIIWRDLSSYDPDRAAAFYARALGWRVTSEKGGYRVFATAQGDIGGLFAMPEKFRQIKMPAFWMSYFAVSDVVVTVAQAGALGGRVELGPEPGPSGGRFALIRDPLGAGFTVFEDAPFQSTAPARHFLCVSEASQVMPFYEALFDWRFVPQTGGQTILKEERKLGDLLEIPDPAVRGKEQYWGIVFPGSVSQVRTAGGHLEAEISLPDGVVSLMRDPDGAAFLVDERAATGDVPRAAHGPWRAWLGFGLVLASLVPGWTGWVWLVFLSAWLGAGLRDGATYLFEPVTRAEHPGLYWLLMLSYAILAVLIGWETLTP